jgi:prophage regulatory protein
MNDRLIKPTELAEMMGVSRTTIWNWINDGALPPRKKISNRTVGWFESDIKEWKESLKTVEECQK